MVFAECSSAILLNINTFCTCLNFSFIPLAEGPLGKFEPLSDGAYTILCHDSHYICDTIDAKFPHIKLPDKKITLSLNGGCKRYTKDEWREEEKSYFKSMFCMKGDINIKESIQWPPYQNTDIAKLCSVIKSFISQDQNGLGAVITQYNPMEHIKFFNYSLNDVLEELHLTDCTRRYNESALIFVHYLNAIIYIKHTLSENICVIEHELKTCKEDLLLFLFVNREFALSGDICFLNIVAAPNFLDTGRNFKCENSFTPIIGESVLRTDANFKDWWDNTFMSYIRKFGKSSGNEFTCLLRSTLTYMATLTVEDPTLLTDPDYQIRTLLLSNEQFRAVHSSSNKKIIVGGFGSGKSVVARYQLKVLVDNAKTAIKIFYICYDTKSMHIYTMKHFAECLNISNNVEIITENMDGLRNYLELDDIPPLSKLLDILVRRFSNQTIHLIMDEFNGETLDMSEAEELKKMYDTREGLQNSTVLLMVHSLEHQRTYTSYGKKIYHKSYNYNETGMPVIVLSKCLRNPINIFNLNKSLKEELSKETNIVCHPTASQDHETDHAGNESNTTADYISLKNPVDHKGSRDLKEQISLEDISPQLSTETTERDHANLSEFKNGNESNTISDYISLKNPVDHKESRDLKEQISLEDISPQLSTEICNKSITTETSYKFQSSEDVWHSIEGNRPLLLVFDKQSSNEADCIAKTCNFH